MSCAKIGRNDQDSLWDVNLGGPRNHVLDGVQIIRPRGAILRAKRAGHAQTCLAFNTLETTQQLKSGKYSIATSCPTNHTQTHALNKMMQANILTSENSVLLKYIISKNVNKKCLAEHDAHVTSYFTVSHLFYIVTHKYLVGI